MLLEKRMVHQLFNRTPLVRILLQTTIQKITYLWTYKEITRYLYFIFYYFYQLLFTSYFKRILTHHHLIHHYTYRPNIDLLVIFSTLEDLRTDIEWSSTKSSTKFVVLMNRPTKIAQFDDILHNLWDTSCKTIF